VLERTELFALRYETCWPQGSLVMILRPAEQKVSESVPASGPVARGSVPELVGSLEGTCDRADVALEGVWGDVGPPSQRCNQERLPLRDYSRPRARVVRVLVLSEDARMRRLRVRELLAGGIDVDWAPHVEEVFRRLARARPDVLLVDVPRDPEVVRRVRQYLARIDATKGGVPILLGCDSRLSPELRGGCAAVVRGPGAGDPIVAVVRSLARSYADRR
jgi:hypothetical protein